MTVAPHTGAWIETKLKRFAKDEDEVAPHTGAWIETLFWGQKSLRLSRTPHGCVD